MSFTLIRAQVRTLAWSATIKVVRPTTRLFRGAGAGRTHHHRRGVRATTTLTASSATHYRRRSLGAALGNALASHVFRGCRLFCAGSDVPSTAEVINNRQAQTTGNGTVSKTDGDYALEKMRSWHGEIQPVLKQYLDVSDGKPKKKMRTQIRQHVNPLAGVFQYPVEMPSNWYPKSFKNPTAPLHVDMGCGKNEFLLLLAQAQPERNFLGMEIRRPIAAMGLKRTIIQGLTNCLVVCCNVNVDFDSLMNEASAQGAVLDCITMHFPDPQFKAKKRKRRMLQPPLLKDIEKHLQPGGRFFIQSDYFPIMEEMRTMVRESGVLVDSREDYNDWMQGQDQNPFEIPTYREEATYSKNDSMEAKVYRALFHKKMQ